MYTIMYYIIYVGIWKSRCLRTAVEDGVKNDFGRTIETDFRILL